MTKSEAVQKVIELAKSQVGYCEKKSNRYLDDFTTNAGSGNYTKYARDMDKIGYFNYDKQAVSWCAVFVHWLFVNCFGKDKAQKMLYCGAKSGAAGCWIGAQYFRNNKAFYTNPQVGDQIFFGKKTDEEHTGIVWKVEGGKVYTIEGNSSNRVKSNTYALNNSWIAGYGRPDWSLVADGISKDTDKQKDETKNNKGVCTVYLNVLQKGSTGNSVKALQGILIANGFSCGRYGADGDFGSDTYNAVRNFQKAKGLEVDGIVGQNTWNKLLN